MPQGPYYCGNEKEKMYKMSVTWATISFFWIEKIRGSYMQFWHSDTTWIWFENLYTEIWSISKNISTPPLIYILFWCKIKGHWIITIVDYYGHARGDDERKEEVKLTNHNIMAVNSRACITWNPSYHGDYISLNRKWFSNFKRISNIGIVIKIEQAMICDDRWQILNNSCKYRFTTMIQVWLA